MTRVALLSRSADLDFLRPLLLAQDASLDIATWPDPRCLEAEVAVCWQTPPGLYAQMPRLRLVHSIAAGVDNVVDGQALRGLPVCRVVDPLLAQGMLQYVLWGVLHFHRHFDRALANQRRAHWQRHAQVPASGCRVGLMGLGELGGLVARQLAAMGYGVGGWARTPRSLDGVQTFSGDQGLQPFLACTDVLVCLLPLTDATRGILGADCFAALPAGAALIHCGRGEHLVADDLLAALDSGHLRGAVLDVFETEPLPAEHALWRAPGVVVTPHMASMAGFDVVVRQIADNVARLRAGEPLRHQVDTVHGY
jgi:glyoxylate/hydroxypyruvate reductase A